MLSILLYSPELILGVLRVGRAVWAQSSGSANWKPQEFRAPPRRGPRCRNLANLALHDAVEREVEQNLSLCYVFKRSLGRCQQPAGPGGSETPLPSAKDLDSFHVRRRLHDIHPHFRGGWLWGHSCIHGWLHRFDQRSNQAKQHARACVRPASGCMDMELSMLDSVP